MQCFRKKFNLDVQEKKGKRNFKLKFKYEFENKVLNLNSNVGSEALKSNLKFQFRKRRLNLTKNVSGPIRIWKPLDFVKEIRLLLHVL